MGNRAICFLKEARTRPETISADGLWKEDYENNAALPDVSIRRCRIAFTVQKQHVFRSNEAQTRSNALTIRTVCDKIDII